MDEEMEENSNKITNDSETMVNIVLYEPEIPANTGNIGRLCVGTNSVLHIIKPMRFLITDKYVKRAGLDYWEKLEIHLYDSLDELLNKFKDKNVFYCTTKSSNKYSEVKYQKGDLLIFGPESRGIPEEILFAKPDDCITIPMSNEIRSMNLSNSVAVILYEACRQIGFNF